LEFLVIYEVAPLIIGALSDSFGLFQAAMIAPIMMGVSGIIFFHAMRCANRREYTTL